MGDKFYIKQNDTSPSLLAVLKDADDVVVDITGATIRFHMRNGAGTTVVDAAAVVAGALTGEARYDWIATDTVTVGGFNAEFEVTYSDGTIETFPNTGYIQVRIKDDIA
jgi:hypothetical protein